MINSVPSYKKQSTSYSNNSTNTLSDNYQFPYINSSKCGIVSSFLATSHRKEKSYADSLNNITCISNITINSQEQCSQPDLSSYKINYFALFEGCDSSTASIYLKKNFHNYLFEDEEFLICTYQSFINAFEKCQIDIQSSNIVTSSSGLIVLIVDNICYICSLGCSRCIMSTYNSNNIYQMTLEQNLNLEEEKERITKLGGKVEKFDGNNYLMPEMKECVRMVSNDNLSNYSTQVPDVVTFQIKDNVDFIIMMNQGIFDYLSNEEVVYSIYKSLKEIDIRKGAKVDETYFAIVKEIFTNSSKRGNDCDDMDIVIIFFDNFVKYFIDPLQRALKIENVMAAIENKIKYNNYAESYFDFITNQSALIRRITIYDEMKKKKNKKKNKEDQDRSIYGSLSSSPNLSTKKKESFCSKLCSCCKSKQISQKKLSNSTQLELMKMQ